MGTVVTLSKPDIEAAEWYACYLDAFFEAPGNPDCDSPYVGSILCCKLGADITDWQDFGFECTSSPPRDQELCAITGSTSQRLISIIGSYDLEADCKAAHGL